MYTLSLGATETIFIATRENVMIRFAMRVLLLNLVFHVPVLYAAAFDCEGIGVTYIPDLPPMNGHSHREKMLIVGGVPASGLHMSGDLGLQDMDSIQVIGMNGGNVNFSSYPAVKEFRLVVMLKSNAVSYECKRLISD